MLVDGRTMGTLGELEGRESIDREKVPVVTRNTSRDDDPQKCAKSNGRQGSSVYKLTPQRRKKAQRRRQGWVNKGEKKDTPSI